MESLHVLAPAAALVAGFAHALEADHMAAVTTFVSRRPRPLEAIGFGLRWGLGHAAAVLVAGSLLIAFGVRFPEGVARGLEFGVGAMLVGLGGWLLWTLLHERAHGSRGVPVPGHGHRQGRGSIGVGLAHGLAGTAPLVAALSVSAAGSPLAAAGYLLLFGAGTVLAMALYAAVAGAVFAGAAGRVPALGSVFRGAAAIGCSAIGVLWMINAAGSA
jgi:hypothetical protein